MYYNMDVMAENGWEVPTTKEELVELMPKMQEAGVIPIAFGNSNYQGAVDWLYSTFTSCYAGPDAVKAAMEGTGKYTDDTIKDSLQTMVDWCTRDGSVIMHLSPLQMKIWLLSLQKEEQQ